MFGAGHGSALSNSIGVFFGEQKTLIIIQCFNYSLAVFIRQYNTHVYCLMNTCILPDEHMRIA